MLDNKEFPLDSPYTWKRSTASPEDISQREELSEDLMDAQIVWNFGYLALSMLMGFEYMRRLNKENNVLWSQVK